MDKKLIIGCICLMFLFVACEEPLIDKNLLTQDDEKIVFGRVSIDNPNMQKYEIMEYDECDAVDWVDICKFVVFEDETTFVIMSYNMGDSLRYLAEMMAEELGNITDEQLKEANTTREELEESLNEWKRI